ncbi:DNA-3-methyladenine glycosylase I [Luteibacter sp. UNCMF331Sha3.1]|jgi:DNA-3-methyladenine glycosylase I|nr:DNA-3-methyladenine glycosylase I [Luteibacter sp. UNCMF331Sha3.1]SEN53050.1 DNA-3-methyladenine glycosylase I [Luteibacter sp. UNCMF331Sha3.1]
MRCTWAERSDIERAFHDTEWGVPVHDDRQIFERLALCTVQAGLALRTVLAKRDSLRAAFHGFDIARIAAMTDDDIAVVLSDRGVVRNRLKIEAIRSNARATLRIVAEHGSLSTFLWGFVDPNLTRRRANADPLPGRSEASDRMSDALRAKGFRFAGTAICHAMMQSTGMVNDHAVECFRYG